MDLEQSRPTEKRPAWARLIVRSVPFLLLAAFMVAGMGSALPLVQAQGSIEIINRTSPNVILDANKPGVEGPDAFTVNLEVCNNGTKDLTDVIVYIGDYTLGQYGVFPVNPTGQSLKLLDTQVRWELDGVPDDYSDGMRCGTCDLAIGACVEVFIPLWYDTVAGLDGMTLEYDVWVDANVKATGDAVQVPLPDQTVTLRDEITASANKIMPSAASIVTISPDRDLVIGETVEVCYLNVDFGVVGNGQNGVNDFWFQPIGETSFDPDKLRLVETSATLYTNKCTDDPYTFSNELYFNNIDSGDWDGDGDTECAANSQQITGDYCYTFLAIAEGGSTLVPYQQASSGNEQKYNADYESPPTITTITNEPSCSILLEKSADKYNIDVFPSDLTYTVEYTNLSAEPVGYYPGNTLVIHDVIPTNTEYMAGTANCGGLCRIMYSIDGGIIYSADEPVPASQVTDLRFVFTDPIDPAPAVPPNGSTSYTVWVPVDTVIDAGAAESNFDGGARCSASNEVQTTPVTLSYFWSARSGDVVRFEWSTATETGNLGFNLYAVGQHGRQQINQDLIPSHVVDSHEPQDYVYEATGISSDRFFLEDVDVRGRPRKHGPFALGQEYGARIPAEPVDWTAIRAEHETKEATRAAQSRRPGIKDILSAGAPKGEKSRAQPLGLDSISLLVDRDGLYRVTYEDLLAAGFDLAEVKTSDLALTNRGVPVPIRVEGGVRFGPGAYFDYYGQALDTLYTHTNVYRLVVDRNLALRATADGRVPDPGVQPAAFYMETVTVEDDALYFSGSPSGDPWYDTRLFARQGAIEQTFSLAIDNYVADAAPAGLLVGVWGRTSYPRKPDHHITVGFNGESLADEWFDGRTDYPISVPLPDGLLKEGPNALTLGLPHDTGAPYDMIGLDRYGVTYPRDFLARDGWLAFDGAGDVFRVRNLPEEGIVVYRLDGTGLAQLAQVQIDAAADSSYSATFPGSTGEATYLVSTEAALLTPGIEAGPAGSGITDGSANYVIISHPDFAGGLAPLVAAREAQGYAVRVVNVEDIYAQFSYGIFDPQAIRDFVAHAADNMGAQYFLLVGGDTYDYHNYLGLGAVSFVPSLYAQTDDLVFFAPVDPLYTDLNDDGVPDRAIGRLPVRTSEELEAVIAKIGAYDGKAYNSTAVFAADEFDGYRSYTQDSDGMVSQLPAGWDVQRAYMDSDGLDNARTKLTDSINGGVALTNFAGHSAETVWTFDPLFNRSDAAGLENDGKPTVVTQYGCWNTWYVATHYDTLADAFLLAGGQGAAAVMGPAALADGSSEAAFGQLLTAQLSQPGMTIGAAVQAAKAEWAATGEGTADLLLGWSILGDPALVVEP